MFTTKLGKGNLHKNGTLAVVTALTAIVRNTAHGYPVSWFRQKSEIPGASYYIISIMGQQFSIQIALALLFIRCRDVLYRKPL